MILLLAEGRKDAALTVSFFQAGADVKATREDGRDGDAKVSSARQSAGSRHRWLNPSSP